MTVHSLTDMRVHARALAAEELNIFPLYPLNADGSCACGNASCGSPGKHPLAALVPHGLLDATRDLAIIDQWWSAWPDANLAIQTGTPNDLIVLDIDAQKGGWGSLTVLEEEHGPLPATPTVETGGAGGHLYFAHPGGTVPNSAGLIAPGIDVRGDGGYVVAPPSSHQSGRPYRWTDGFALTDLPLAPMPAWLRECIASPASRGRGARLAEDELLAEGSRNDRLMRIGAAFRRYGLTEREIAAALHAVNAARCRPPLDAAEVGKIATSVCRYQPAPPQPTLARPVRRTALRHVSGRRTIVLSEKEDHHAG